MLRLMVGCRFSRGTAGIFRCRDMSSAVFSRAVSTTSSDSSQQAVSTRTEPMIPFVDYIKYKKRVRSVQLLWALPCGMTGMTTSAYVVASTNPNLLQTPPEEIVPILGMEPLVFYGFIGVVNGFMAAAMGHYLFGQLWHRFNSRLSADLLERDNDFKTRLAKHRCETESRYEDDYFGDKIRTIWDYRQWVRSQQQKRAELEKMDAETHSAN